MGGKVSGITMASDDSVERQTPACGRELMQRRGGKKESKEGS